MVEFLYRFVLLTLFTGDLNTMVSCKGEVWTLCDVFNVV